MMLTFAVKTVNFTRLYSKGLSLKEPSIIKPEKWFLKNINHPVTTMIHALTM
jgi:hypothetical protein